MAVRPDVAVRFVPRYPNVVPWLACLKKRRRSIDFIAVPLVTMGRPTAIRSLAGYAANWESRGAEPHTPGGQRGHHRSSGAGPDWEVRSLALL
jgi:hypothetical protein